MPHLILRWRQPIAKRPAGRTRVLSKADIQYIRTLYHQEGYSIRTLADIFNIGKSTVNRCVQNKYANIPDRPILRLRD